MTDKTFFIYPVKSVIYYKMHIYVHISVKFVLIWNLLI